MASNTTPVTFTPTTSAPNHAGKKTPPPPSAEEISIGQFVRLESKTTAKKVPVRFTNGPNSQQGGILEESLHGHPLLVMKIEGKQNDETGHQESTVYCLMATSVNGMNLMEWYRKMSANAPIVYKPVDSVPPRSWVIHQPSCRYHDQWREATYNLLEAGNRPVIYLARGHLAKETYLIFDRWIPLRLEQLRVYDVSTGSDIPKETCVNRDSYIEIYRRQFGCTKEVAGEYYDKHVIKIEEGVSSQIWGELRSRSDIEMEKIRIKLERGMIRNPAPGVRWLPDVNATARIRAAQIIAQEQSSPSSNHGQNTGRGGHHRGGSGGRGRGFGGSPSPRGISYTSRGGSPHSSRGYGSSPTTYGSPPPRYANPPPRSSQLDFPPLGMSTNVPAQNMMPSPAVLHPASGPSHGRQTSHTNFHHPRLSGHPIEPQVPQIQPNSNPAPTLVAQQRPQAPTSTLTLPVGPRSWVEANQRSTALRPSTRAQSGHRTMGSRVPNGRGVGLTPVTPVPSDHSSRIDPPRAPLAMRRGHFGYGFSRGRDQGRGQPLPPPPRVLGKRDQESCDDDDESDIPPKINQDHNHPRDGPW